MTQTPLERWQKQQELKQNKKRDQKGIYILVGCAIGLVIILAIVMSGGDDDAPAAETDREEEYSGPVDVPDAKRLEVYQVYSFAIDAYGDHEHALKVAAKTFKLENSQVKQIVREGKSKGWPQNKSESR